jgi:class 3 adenylate cyclase/tetratricopeptide (TPR) repeat protein
MMVDNSGPSLERINQYVPPHMTRYLKDGLDLVEAMTLSKHIRSVRGVLSTYLPRYLAESIYRDPKPGRVNGGFLYGAVLFADVSGFTAMSEKLSVLGKEGAEEVTGIVNNYFTAMLAINEHYGGDLLKFGGDALLIFFEGQLGPFNALSASRAMMNAMSEFTQVKTSQGVFPLKMKIGMACGPVFLASLGTPESMDHAIMGSTLSKMAGAEDNATAGEIVIHDDVRKVTGDIASYSPLVQGYWKLDELHKMVEVHDKTPRESTSAAPDPGFDTDILVQNLIRDADIIGGLRPFVPEELFARIIDDPQRITVYGSHRPVTITFTNFFGIDEIIETLGPQNEGAITSILNSHFVTMSEVITRFGGTVNRLDAYSVGHRILALFGALQAHEDDPQRAVQAGIEMNKALQDVNLQAREILNAIPEFKHQFNAAPLKQRIGVNSGFVFAGNTGSKTRREYTVMGDQVNLTARLMSIAKEGEVLIGQSTARHTEEVFILNEQEAVKVKGKTDPVRNFVVQKAVERSHWKTRLASSPIVGRDEELGRGREAVDQALAGQASVLVISGVSGMGKTRLAEELAWYADSKDMDLLVGTCLSYGKTMTYHPWAEVLRELFAIDITDPAQNTEKRIAAVKRGLAAVDEELWAPVIGTMLGLEIPENDLTRDLDAKLRRQRVLDLTVKLLKARAHSKPLMLVIEDAHWADPASMDLIDYVARNIAAQPILFMLPHRPDIGLPEWTAYPHAIDIELIDLPDEACKEIIGDMVGGIQLPEAMYGVILSRGCGNPFFIGEVVRALIDAGALERDADGIFHVIQDMSTVDLPDTIHGVIISRIDRLITSDRRILQVASVIGRVFAYRTLDSVYSSDDIETSLRERLNYLSELGLTEVQVIESELYRFIHLTTREVVYEGLPFEHRRSLHRQIGDFIEETSAGSLGEQTNLLAYHYYEGQAWQKAMSYNLTAAQHAQREFANDTAILSAERALESADNLGPDVDTSQDRLGAHETLGEVMTLVGRYDEALEQYGQARELVESEKHTAQRQSHLAELSRKTAEVYERRSEYDTALEWLEKGLQYLDEDQVSIEVADIYLLVAGVYHRQAKNEQASQWCLRSIDIASQINSLEGRRSLGNAYKLEGAVQYRLGNLIDTIELCKKSLKIFQEIKDVIGEAVAYNNLSNAYAELGEWEQANDALQRCRQIYQRVGDVFGQGFAANNLAYIHLERGEWDQAKYLFIESNQIWKKIGATSPDAVSLSNLAQVYIYQENWEQAKATLSESQGLFDKIGSDDFLAELERRWGEYYLGIGDIEQALNHTQRAVEVAKEQEARLDWGLSLRVLGEILLERGDTQAASEKLQEALSILKELGSDYEAAKTSLVIARVALKERKKVDLVSLQQAAEVFEDLGAKADLSQAISLLNQVN